MTISPLQLIIFDRETAKGICEYRDSVCKFQTRQFGEVITLSRQGSKAIGRIQLGAMTLREHTSIRLVPETAAFRQLLPEKHDEDAYWCAELALRNASKAHEEPNYYELSVLNEIKASSHWLYAGLLIRQEEHEKSERAWSEQHRTRCKEEKENKRRSVEELRCLKTGKRTLRTIRRLLKNPEALSSLRAASKRGATSRTS